jgi:Tfp pilus assembly protein PilO
MRSHLRHKSLAAIMAGAILLLFGIGVYVYRARARTLTTLRVELNEKKGELAAARARIAKRPQLEKEYADLQVQLAVLEPALPTYAYVPTFLKQLEGLAQATDNGIAGVRPQIKPQAPAPAPPTAKAAEGEGDSPPQPAQPQNQPAPQGARSAQDAYDRLPIEVSLKGGYWEAARFLADLASFPKMIAVSEMQVMPVSRTDLAGVAPDLQVKLNLLALVYKEGVKEPWTSDAKNSSS